MLKVGIRAAIALLLFGVALALVGIYLIFPPAVPLIAGCAVIAFVLYRVDIRLDRGDSE